MLEEKESSSMDVETTDDNLETEEMNEYEAPQKERTLVGCWKNKEEFKEVLGLLYGSEPNHERALDILHVWKIRRMDQTPATILATAALLEIMLTDKDDKPQLELRLLYSSAITRFFSYVSSTIQGKTGFTRKTMYDLAAELGLASVVVDIRHLCSHGQEIPSLEMLRATSQYCFEWLRSYYWEEQYENMRDCELSDLRKTDTNDFDDTISKLFGIYDIGIEAVFQKREELSVVRNFIHKNKYELLKKYSEEKGGIENVYDLMDELVKDLFEVVKKAGTIRDFIDIYVTAFFRMKNFFEIGAKITTMEELELAIKSTKLLFSATAMNSLTEDLYHALIEVCENPSEPLYKRKGAGFWANEIVKGFIAFEQLRIYCHQNNIQDTRRPLDLKKMMITKEIQKTYKKLMIDTNKTIIFGDSLKRPWRLTFDKAYILERMEKLNEFTSDVVKSCLDLVKPPFTDNKKEELMTLMDVKLGVYVNETEPVMKPKIGSKIYDLSDLEIAERQNEEESISKETFGIWTRETGDWNWSECPIGILPWQ